MDGGFGFAGVEPEEIFAEAGEALFVGVGAEEVSGGAEGGGDEKGFAAGGGAGVEDAFAGLRIQQIDGVASGGVLDVDLSRGEEVGGWRAFEVVEAGCVFDRGEVGEVGCGSGERVGAEVVLGGLVVPFHEGDGVGLAEFGFPAVIEPVGMGVDDGGGEIAEVEEALAGGDGAAEDGVDEGADAGFSGFDGFVDGGMVGDAEDEDLDEADAEDVAGFGVELAVAEFADPVVEEAAVAEDAEEDGLEQSAVLGGKHAAVGVAVDEGFCVVVALCPRAES